MPATLELPVAVTATRRAALGVSLRRHGPRLAAWTLGFAPVLYLALRGGGYDLVIYSEVGLAAWWIVFLGVLVGVMPLQRLGRLAWVAIGLLGAFALWTGIAATWSQSAESTVAELGRVVAYLGFFVLALCVVRRDTLRQLGTGIGVAFGVVGALAVLSRLHPSLFPGNQVAAFLPGARARLSYPLNYANGTGEFVAIGIPLLLLIATSGRTLAGRALGAAAVPVTVLALVFTVSRGGIVAAIIAALAFYALSPDRLPKLAAGLPAAAGSAILVAALVNRVALRNGLSTPLAISQRHQLTYLVLAVCTGVAAAQVLIDLVGRQIERPKPLRISRPGAMWLTAAALALALMGAIAVGAPGKLAHEWRVFKRPSYVAVGAGNVYSRLGTSRGSDLYQYWVAQAHAFESRPLSGIGPGTFQFYWARHANVPEPARSGHSLYLQTLAETGVVGFVLIAGFFLVLLGTGVRRALDTSIRTRIRTTLAAMTAALIAFCVAAGYDWLWQLPAVALVALLLCAAILASRRPATRASNESPLAGRWWAVVRGLAVAAAAFAIIAIAIPYGATVAIRSSQAKVRAGQLDAALGDAATAQRLEPYAATPRLQRALIAERAGDLREARTEIAEATAREPSSGIWLVRARIDAESGQERAAAADYRRAHALSPRWGPAALPG